MSTGRPSSRIPSPGDSASQNVRCPAGREGNVSRVVSPILTAAVREAAREWQRESTTPVCAGEAVEVMVALARTVEARRADPAAPLDAAARSPLAQQLIELLRSAVIRSWPGGEATAADVLATLAALEDVRAALEPDWLRDFGAPLSGPNGLEVVVEIAHDLRSPLTSILFLAETLQRGQSGPVDELQRRQLALIYGAALGLSSIASDIIELARGGDQLVEKQPVPFAVTTVLESVRDIVRPIAEEKQLTMRLCPPEADHRLGHPVAISRVLLNLTTNALKFTERGFVEIVTRELDRDRIEFAVRDSGKGIAPHILDTIWQPLRRAEGPGRYAFSPSGLGLTMCRKLVHAMGSELRVETQRGWGTRFFFELALPQYPDPQPPEATGQAGRPRPGKRGERPNNGRAAVPPKLPLPLVARSPGLGAVTTFPADP